MLRLDAQELAVVYVVVGSIGGLAFLAFAWTATRDSRRRRLAARIRQLDATVEPILPSAWNSKASVHEAEASPSRLKSTTEVLLPTGEDDLTQIRLRLRHAGLDDLRTLHWFYAARLIGLVAPFLACFGLHLAGYLTFGKLATVVVAASTFGWLSPSWWLERRIATRQNEIRSALPDFMDLLIVCLQSGMTVPSALQRVGQEIIVAHPLLASELEAVQRDTALGAPVDVALFNFAQRTGVEALRELASFVRESRRFGTEVAEALRTQADTMRFQREQAAEEAAQKASVKILFPMLLFILPAIFVVLVGPAVIQIQKAFQR